MIELKNVTIHNRLNHINLSLKPNDMTFVMGPNGAGKSTLLQTLSGSLKADQGDCLIQNQAYPNAARLSRIRAVLPQQYFLPAYFSVHSLLIETSPKQALPYFDEVIYLLRLEPLLHQDCEKLSGGQVQRVMLAKTLLQLLAWQHDEPQQYLLLDEPTAALDLHMAHHVMDALQTLQTQYHWGIFILCHDLHLSSKYAKDVIMLKEASILQQGPAKSILNAQHLSLLYDCPFQKYQDEQGKILYLPQ